VAGAAELLGRPHEGRGTVERGDGRGRELGFPTANLMGPPTICLPGDGVYAGTYRDPAGVQRVAASSAGTRPTSYAQTGRLPLHAHGLAFDGDLYDQAAAVGSAARIRGQERCEDVDDLIARMHADADETRRLISPPGADGRTDSW